MMVEGNKKTKMLGILTMEIFYQSNEKTRNGQKYKFFKGIRNVQKLDGLTVAALTEKRKKKEFQMKHLEV